MSPNLFFNVELIYVFILVSDAKSISKAADKLHISQPAVSKKIKALEKLVGKQLFHRSHQGVSLTQDGQQLYLKGADFLQKTQDFIQSVQVQPNIANLTIGCLDSISSQIFSKFFTEYLSYFKKIRVTTNIFELIEAFNIY